MELAAYLVPPLTTVHLPFEETGALATALLLRAVRGEPVPARELLPVELTVRATTARPPPRTPKSRASSGRTRSPAKSQGGAT
jgi:LacI family transcriptional regulator